MTRSDQGETIADCVRVQVRSKRAGFVFNSIHLQLAQVQKPTLWGRSQLIRPLHSWWAACGRSTAAGRSRSKLAVLRCKYCVNSFYWLDWGTLLSFTKSLFLLSTAIKRTSSSIVCLDFNLNVTHWLVFEEKIMDQDRGGVEFSLTVMWGGRNSTFL